MRRIAKRVCDFANAFGRRFGKYFHSTSREKSGYAVDGYVRRRRSTGLRPDEAAQLHSVNGCEISTETRLSRSLLISKL
jgi:hypothetical protein